MVSRQAEDVVYAQRAGTQQLGLQGDPVAVSAGELQDGLNPPVLQQVAKSQRSHAHNGTGPVRHVDRIGLKGYFLRRAQHGFGVGALGSIHFHCHDESAAADDFRDGKSFAFHRIVFPFSIS